MPETLRVVQGFANEIKAQPGRYMGFSLTEQDLGSMLTEGTALAMKQIPGIAVSSNLRVNIAADKCSVAGTVNIDHPAFGHNDAYVDLRLGNSATPGVLEVESFRLDKHLSLRVKSAATIAGIDIDGEIRRALGNPGAALYQVMKEELRKQGVTLEQMGLQFSGDQLLLGISGRPIR